MWEPREPARCDFYPEKGPDGLTHYQMLTQALVEAGRKIQEFMMPGFNGSGMPSSIFKQSSVGTRKTTFADIEAFSCLERLKLRLASFMVEGTPTSLVVKNAGRLPILFASIDRLKHLKLDLLMHFDELPIFYGYNQVSPKDGQWRLLESLLLLNFSIKAVGLLELILPRTPNLKHVTLGDMKLLEGTWEAFLKALKLANGLSPFNLSMGSFL